MRFVVFLVMVVLGGSVLAGSGSEEARLQALLDEFLVGASANDRDVHDRFWSDELIYTSAAGLRFGKAEIMDGLSAADPAAQGPAYEGRDVQIRLFGETAVVTFVLVATEASGEQTRFLNTGVFRRGEEHWQAVAWQATRAAETSRPDSDEDH